MGFEPATSGFDLLPLDQTIYPLIKLSKVFSFFQLLKLIKVPCQVAAEDKAQKKLLTTKMKKLTADKHDLHSRSFSLTQLSQFRYYCNIRSVVQMMNKTGSIYVRKYQKEYLVHLDTDILSKLPLMFSMAGRVSTKNEKV